MLSHLKAEITTNEEEGKLAQSIKTGQLSPAWTFEDGLILYKQWVHIPSSSPILQEVLHAIHNSTHEGSEKTLHRFRQTFHTPRAKQIVQQFVSDCTVCQRNNNRMPPPS